MARTMKEYQRLEFLGDSILQFVISLVLFKKDKEYNEGDLSKRRSFIVNNDNLSEISKELQLDRFFDITIEENSTKQWADIYEAYVGHLYQRHGIKTAQEFIVNSGIIENGQDRDYKGKLLEYWAQGNLIGKPKYKLVKSTGPGHRRRFLIKCVVGDKISYGEFTNKKGAEQLASQEMLGRLGVECA